MFVSGIQYKTLTKCLPPGLQSFAWAHLLYSAVVRLCVTYGATIWAPLEGTLRACGLTLDCGCSDSVVPSAQHSSPNSPGPWASSSLAALSHFPVLQYLGNRDSHAGAVEEVFAPNPEVSLPVVQITQYNLAS